MRLPVTKQSKKEYINEMRQRYHAATKQEQTKLLDEIVKVCSFNRKYLIKMLNKKPGPKYPLALYGGTKKKAGNEKEYHAAEILAFRASTVLITFSFYQLKIIYSFVRGQSTSLYRHQKWENDFS